MSNLKWRALIATAMSTSACGTVAAETIPPPTYDITQLNPPGTVAIGVNPINRGFMWRENDVVAGPKDAELVFTRTYESTLLWRFNHLGFGWYHNFDWETHETGDINSLMTVRITNGSQSYEFDKQRTAVTYNDATLFKAKYGDDARLMYTTEFQMDSNHPTLELILPNGTAMLFSSGPQSGQGGNDCIANVAYGCGYFILERFPNGRIIKALYYKEPNISFWKPKLIYDNYGNGLSFSYTASVSEFISSVQAVTVKNSGCPSGDAVCADVAIGAPVNYTYDSTTHVLLTGASSSWKSMLYGYESYVEGTPSPNPGWENTTWYRVKTVSANTASSPIVTNTYLSPANYPGSAAVVSQVGQEGQAFTISMNWGFSGGNPKFNFDTIVTDSAGDVDKYRINGYPTTNPVVTSREVQRISSHTNPVGQVTTFQYDYPYTRRVKTIFPELNTEVPQYDTNGNVASVTSTAKSGTPSMVAYHNYSTTCASPTTCYQLLYDTDRRTNVTNYDYYADGTLHTITGPADLNGLRPLTTMNYSTFTGVDGSSFKLKMSQIVKIDASSALTTNYVYDTGNKFVLKATEATDGVKIIRTCFKYDAIGNLISRTAPNGALNACP